MREFWSGFFGSLTGVAAGIVILGAAGAFLAAVTATALVRDAQNPILAAQPDASVWIEVDLRAVLVDDARELNAQPISTPQASAFDVTRALYRAADDPRVAGAMILTGGGSIAPGHAEEIAAVSRRLASTGRSVFGYVEADGRDALYAYLAGAGAGEVWAAPLAAFSALPDGGGGTGLSASDSAIIEAASRLRAMGPEQMRAALSDGPISASEALEAGLIDRIGSEVELRARLAQGSRDLVVGVDDYLAAPSRGGGAASLALIEVNGFIQSGAHSGQGRVGAARAVEAITAAARSDSVRAIIVRISANGGAAAASDQIASAIMAAQRRGKPVIALVGSAAMGWAYHAIAPADRIITPGAAQLGQLGQARSRLPRALSAAAAETAPAPSGSLDSMRYAWLVEGVADARGLPLGAVETLARGQGWSGAQAVRLGLADQVGDLSDAVAAARERAGMAPDEPAVLGRYPPPPTRLQAISARLVPAPASR